MNNNIMSIHSKRGTKVMIIPSTMKNGWGDGCTKQVEDGVLALYKNYTVDYIDIGQSISYVYLKEMPNRSFNTVNFVDVDKQLSEWGYTVVARQIECDGNSNKLIADKATLLAIKDYMRVGDWDPREVQEMILGDTDMLKHKIMGDIMLSTDECCIVWGEDDYVCMLDEFLDKYFESFMKRICDVIMSFEDNDIGYIGYNHKEFEEYVK